MLFFSFAVPGDKIAQGKTVTSYMGPAPPRGTGLHRYAFLVCRQEGKIAKPEVPHDR